VWFNKKYQRNFGKELGEKKKAGGECRKLEYWAEVYHETGSRAGNDSQGGGCPNRLVKWKMKWEKKGERDFAREELCARQIHGKVTGTKNEKRKEGGNEKKKKKNQRLENFAGGTWGIGTGGAWKVARGVGKKARGKKKDDRNIDTVGLRHKD